MWLFPYKRFTIITHVEFDETVQQLTNNINPPPIYRWFRAPLSNNEFDRYFYGTIKGSVFEMHRAITKGRNSFLPLIKCVIIEKDELTHVKVRMRLHPLIIIFCLWVLIIGWFNKSTLGDIVFTYDHTALFVFLAIYGLALFSFIYESQKDKKILLKILNGEVQR